jgi:hypothetical protein
MRGSLTGVVAICLSIGACSGGAGTGPARSARSGPAPATIPATIKEPAPQAAPATSRHPSAPPAASKEDELPGPEIMSEVPCKTADDCWVKDGAPVARPARLRGRRFRPCRDGEAAPVCFKGRCGLVTYGC